MTNEYVEAFKGTRDEADGIAKKIQQQLERLALKHNDFNKRQLELSVSVLRALCLVCQKSEGNHIDIYCDVLVNVVAPYLKPESNPKYWSTYLEYIRYIHHLIIEKKMFAEAARVCDHISSFSNSLQNDGDYKLILGTYTHHLLCQFHHMRVNPITAQEHMVQTLDDMIELFSKMLRCKKELNFQYPELIADFAKYLVPKRAQPILNFLASLPANKTQMYDAFFRLLSEQGDSQPEKVDLQLHCQRHMEALGIFIHLDATDRLQQQLALRQLRVCRDLKYLQHTKSSSYVFSLLYYLFKLVYGVPPGGQFTTVFKDLNTKMVNFFDKYGESLMQDRWFTDVPVVISILLTHIHQHPKTPFTAFWDQMTNIECYVSHTDLILACIRLAPHIAETKLMTIECCTSARKHTIISLVLSALATFSSYMQNVKPLNGKEQHRELLTSLRTNLLLVMRHAVSVFGSLCCIKSTSPELKMLFARFVQLTCDVRTGEQAKLCLTLTELLIKIRHKFASDNWTVLLRRLYKMSIHVEDNKLTTELHVAHIASIFQESTWPDMELLRNRVGFFYTASSHVTPGQSILQVNDQSRNIFKIFLEPRQKRLLHWLETQQFIRYHKNVTQLQIALMDCSQSLYDEVMVGRGAGYLQSEVSNRLRKIKKDLEQKSLSLSGLTRLEYLILAHIGTSLLHEQLKFQKQSLPTQIKCSEDNLGELLQYKELSAITVANEVRMVKKANEAMHAFKEFFDKADKEFISFDEAFIDWEAIMDDLSSLALYLQLAGYLDSALWAWVLHYRISNTLDDQYSGLRGLAYFCENAEFFDNPGVIQINLEEELSDKQKFLLDAAQQLPLLPKRLQNFVLICFCQVAYFYARKENFSYALMLLNFVQHAHSELPEQQGKYNVVLGTIDIVKFRILWKHFSNGSRKETNEFMKKCLMREMEQTLDRFRGEFFKLSTSELMSYTILLLSLIVQVAECAANRLCDYFVNSYFSGLFTILLQSGLALRIVQLLTMWSWINLQMEYVNKAQIKLKLIEYIMGVNSIDDFRQLSEEITAEKQPSDMRLKSMDLFHSEVEPVRKVAQQLLSPIKTEKMQLSSISLRNNNLKRFLSSNKNECLQQNEILQWCYFIVGCLNARLYFLVENYDQLEDFYESSQLWLSERRDVLLSTNFQNIKLLNIQHYANYLRFHNKYEKALSYLQSALDDCNRVKGNVDNVYRINLIVQLNATKNEVLQIKEAKNHLPIKRALAFNISPDMGKPEKFYKIVSSGTAKKVSSVSARKKSKPTFTIYGSENESPKAIPQSFAVVHSSKKHVKKEPPSKLKFNDATTSVRKAKKNESINEKKTSKQVSISEFINKAKLINQNEENSSCSSSTPESDMETVLNYCQRIQSIDLLDSDDQIEMPTVIKRSCQKAAKTCENILNICKRVELLDLEDSEHGRTSTVLVSNEQKMIQSARNVVDTKKTNEIIDYTSNCTPSKTPKHKYTKSVKKTAKLTQDPQNTGNKDMSDTAKDIECTKRSPISKTIRIKLVDKLKLSEDIKAIKVPSKYRITAKTEVRTLKVMNKETAAEISSSEEMVTGKENKDCNVNFEAEQADGRISRRPRKINAENSENVNKIGPLTAKPTRKATAKR